jgi:hypothetical protein
MYTIQRKRVHLPEGTDWRGAFIAELVSFPSEFDDQVDAMTQYLTFMATNPHLELPPKRAIAVAAGFSQGPITTSNRSTGPMFASVPRVFGR